jgi:hypothetical protein
VEKLLGMMKLKIMAEAILNWKGRKARSYNEACEELAKAVIDQFAPQDYDKKECNGCDGSGWQSGDNKGFICDFCDKACCCDIDPDECLVHRGF